MSDRLDHPFPLRPSANASTERKLGWEQHHSFVVLRAWWQGLEHDKGERAALKRAGSLTAVMLSPAFHRLMRELRQAGFGVAEARYPKLAAIAGLVARLKPDKPEPLESIGNRMGTSKTRDGKKAVVSELRVRNILARDDIEDLYALLRRALALQIGRASCRERV